jgi:hypothetical protein
MFYKCLDCGHIFEEGEQQILIDRHGIDFPPYEEHCACPSCGGDYEKAKQCEECGSVFLEDDLTCGFCEECCEKIVKEYSFGHIDELYLINSNSKESVELNRFIYYMFSPEQINEILLNVLKEQDAFKKVDCRDFIKEDEYWFIEQVKKKWKEVE